jgi:alanine racemase
MNFLQGESGKEPKVLNWVEIDGEALQWNLGQFRRRLGESVALGAVVKSNAYGHGMPEIAALAREGGADWLCVNNVDEAVRLRESGHGGKILVMGYVPLDALEPVVRHDLDLVLYNDESRLRLEQISLRLERRAAVHLKVETGTNRQGIPESELKAFARSVHESPGLSLEGICTHFANIEDTTDHGYAQQQVECFERIGKQLGESGLNPPLRHAACSAAALLFTKTHLDLARVGISLYGLWPSKETYVSCLEHGQPALELRPVMTWKSRVAQVKSVPEGGFIGYGCTYRVTRDSRIAVIPVGYFEGYDRGLSGVAYVLVRGRRAPVRGRVCMNMCMVDVTDIPGVELEDEVVLLGRQMDERLSAEQLAQWCGTISYEIVSRIHPSLPRIVVGE